VQLLFARRRNACRPPPSRQLTPTISSNAARPPALIGGTAGVGADALYTAICASSKHELVVVPAFAWGGGIRAAINVGVVAGLQPALRMSPTQALWSM